MAEYDLELLEKMLAVVDEQLDIMEDAFQRMPEYEAFTQFDWAEHITGFGFVACQTYITATHTFLRITKRDAMKVGPKHPESGRPIVAVVNDAANFWKHYPEWSLQKNQKRQDIIRETFETFGFPAGGEYPLSGILTELTTPGNTRFGTLVVSLRQWRDDLIKRETR
jgi:hypothetical protein